MCDNNQPMRVRFDGDSAALDGPRGYEVLYRDAGAGAGGQGARQSHFANLNTRAEFGLGANGREAVLRYTLAPLVLRCVRQ